MVIKKFSLPILIAIFSLLTGCSNHSNTVNLNIPNELTYATDFIVQLNKSDVNVIDVKQSLYENFLEGTNKAVYIATDKGIADVIFFPNHDENKVKIETVSEDETRYKYNVQGKLIDSSRQLYFSVHDDFISVTDSNELDTAIKKAFHTNQ